MHWPNCELTAQWKESRALGDTGSGLCPSTLLPAQWESSIPLQGRKEFSMCHLLYLSHMVHLLVMQCWRRWCCRLPVVSHRDGNREWPSGKAPRIGTRLLFFLLFTGLEVTDYVNQAYFFFSKAKGYEFHMPIVTQKTFSLCKGLWPYQSSNNLHLLKTCSEVFALSHTFSCNVNHDTHRSSAFILIPHWPISSLI